MPIDILMPALSPTMTEGNLVKWLCKEGDKVESGDVIAEIETDKATMEVEALGDGVLAKIIIAEGTEAVKVNSLIAVLLESDEKDFDIDQYLAGKGAETNSVNDVAIETEKETISDSVKLDKVQSDNVTNRIFISPLAKRMAEQNNFDISNIEGTGPRGRIVKNDILNLLSDNKSSELKNNQSHADSQSKYLGNNISRNQEEFIKIPNSTMRKVIAQRLLESKQNIPHFYLSSECVLDKLIKLRVELNEHLSKNNPGTKLSINDFIIAASARALKDVPDVNASWADDAILKYNNVDVSVAVSIDGGLITPIIRNADQKDLVTLSAEMKDLATRAKSNSLKPEEFQGGGFSISNLGMYDVKNFNAIINPPQSAILAIGKSNKRPHIIADEISIATIMDITLSCDHRVLDGVVASRFLGAFKNYIESPLSLLI